MRSTQKHQRPMWRRILSTSWIIMCVVSIVSYIPDAASVSLKVFAQIRPLQALEDFGLLIVVIVVIAVLMSLHPVFKWWIGKLFLTDNDNNEPPSNFNLMPMYVPVLGPIFLLALAFCLPVICHIEEQMFRQGTHSWPEAVLRSLIFGFAHMLVGVPLGGAIALSIVGLWLSECYFQGGIALSTVHHTTYDLMVVTLVGILLLLHGIATKETPEEETATANVTMNN